ncbi:unnamed protein product [Orchesella dallaii]|uniref:Epoxide hydrolase n=1 Tax=Orchesella dallaii TaxID=48710 RepID=A0ABP1QI51_9HEXA
MGYNSHLHVFVALSAVYVAYTFYNLFGDGYVPVADDELFGSKAIDSKVYPFKVEFKQGDIENLKLRLGQEISASKKIPKRPATSSDSAYYGVDSEVTQKLGDYLHKKYDWKKGQARMNKYPHFKTRIAGLDIHFQKISNDNVTVPAEKVRPILVLHGFPSSFAMYQRLIPLFVDLQGSKYKYELVIPSIPGFGFSDAPTRPGLGTVELAHIYLRLMQRLGYEKFFVISEDFGSLIGNDISIMYHKNVMGVHSTTCQSNHPRRYLRLFVASLFPSFFMDVEDAERIYPLSKSTSSVLHDTANAYVQATMAESLGLALSQSPSGLISYFVEKILGPFNGKADEILADLKTDEFLDNVLVYYMTSSITSAMRTFSELNGSEKRHQTESVTSYVPTGCLVFPRDAFTQPEFVMYDKYYQIIRYNKASKGGRFGAFEAPQIVAQDSIDLFKFLDYIGLSLFEDLTFTPEDAYSRNSVF